MKVKVLKKVDVIIDDNGCITALKEGTSLEGVGLIIPSNFDGIPIISIGEKAFYKKGLLGVQFSNTKDLESIDKFAFANNKIKKVIFTFDSPSLIGEEAFANNKIELLSFNRGSNLKKICKKAFSKNKIEKQNISNMYLLEAIEEEAFSQNPLSELNLPKQKFRIEDQSLDII